MNITTPCHGEPLEISSGIVDYDWSEVEGIECPADGCTNKWTNNGTAVT